MAVTSNPYSFGDLGERWIDQYSTTTSRLNKSRVKVDHVKWALDALGMSGEDPFMRAPKVVESNKTLSANYNYQTFGDVTINDGVSVTVPDGCSWVHVGD